VTVKGHGPPKLTVSSSCYKFSNIATVLFLDNFRSYLEKLLLTKLIIFDLRKFYCKISKGLWDILGQTWFAKSNKL